MWCTDRYSGLLEIEPHGQRLAHEDVRVVAGEEGPFQFLQLPAVEVGARSAPFAAAGAVVVRPIAASSITCNMTTQLLRQPVADTFRMRDEQKKTG